ncbi:MAG: SUMF1/EgtB/PvdO family nonheme iron enzyme [Prevotellaceae bacterium]|nr:SUMF1/EgtB/PvdO family nonheme iron enzyme [Candidatus Minthosoma caballi]
MKRCDLMWNNITKKHVENVSRDMCLQFIEKLNALTGAKFRLPTEAEWEYAARNTQIQN